MNERDAAHSWYSDSYKAWAGHRPRGDVSHLSTAELVALGDQYIEWAMDEAKEEEERARCAALLILKARESCSKKNQPKNLAFAKLGDMLKRN
jgi:hypothetical protein